MAQTSGKTEADQSPSGREVGRYGVRPSIIKRSQVAALIMSAQMQGWDPTVIPGAPRLNPLPTVQDPNAVDSGQVSGPPFSDTQNIGVYDNPVLTARDAGRHIDEDMRRSEKGEGAKNKGGSNPYAGMGDF